MGSKPSASPENALGPEGDGALKERDFDDRSPPDRYCDLVLTGGVTSAIAYPGLVFGLAQAYRFHGLGGSSSGAGTAALAAAAEYRRRQGSPEGFRAMLRGSLEMREDADAPAFQTQATARQTKLSWLFQPDAELVRLFDCLVPLVASPNKLKNAKLLRAFVRAYLPGWPLSLGLIWGLSCQVLGALGLLSWGAAALALGAAGLAVLARCWLAELAPDIRRFVASDFGLCTGQQPLPGAPHAPLTVWLHGLIQRVAGRSVDGMPLTFADLHQARGGPADLLGRPHTNDARAIDLRIYTANVTLGRPVVFPQAEVADGLHGAAEDTLYFKPTELRQLFPAVVVDHLLKHSALAAGQPEGDPQARLWLLPRSQLPVIVAARISVAFPALFRAVPLWRRPPVANARSPVWPTTEAFERCLFADGSLCSNFPIHLFDSLLPAWPTFGLSLVERPDILFNGDPESDLSHLIHLPEASCAAGDARQTPASSPGNATNGQLAGFLSAMLSTVMNWHDTALSRLPGVRERVVQVGLPKGIGGLNIFMTRRQIDFLASLGVGAAKALLKRYAVPDHPGGVARGWREHRWLRLRLLLDGLREGLSGVAAASEHARYTAPLTRQIDEATQQAALQGDPGSLLSAGDAAAMKAVLMALAQTEAAVGCAPIDTTIELDPRPVLRVQPPA